jgi:alpha-L-fucosidase 2
MFDAHPPFQIDGNFGGGMGIMEMIVQSWGGEIHLLPALPSAWPSGRLKGVHARGNVRLDIAWAGGKLTALKVYGRPAQEVVLRHGGDVRTVQLDNRGIYQMKA